MFKRIIERIVGTETNRYQKKIFTSTLHTNLGQAGFHGERDNQR